MPHPLCQIDPVMEVNQDMVGEDSHLRQYKMARYVQNEILNVTTLV
jgi:hypothetical protein